MKSIHSILVAALLLLAAGCTKDDDNAASRSDKSSYTVVDMAVDAAAGNVTNPGIVILPCGDYLASCNSVDGESGCGATLYRSTDKGRSWTVAVENTASANGIAGSVNLFVHAEALYMTGTGADGGNVMISRSDDDGATWSTPATAENGIIIDDARTYLSGAVAVVESGGRLWCAMEVMEEGERRPFVLSAASDADLLKAASWTATNAVQYNSAWSANSAKVTSLQFGNVVATPEGSIYNLLSAPAAKTSLTAALARVTGTTTLEIDSANKDFVTMAGGGKKFTVRYDARSDRYWAITNPASDKYYGMLPDGTFSESGGLTYNDILNRAVLCWSKDLKIWYQERVVLQSRAPYLNSYKDADWQFDGNDIVAVFAVADSVEGVAPSSQHNANILAFKRISNFR